MDKIFSCTIYTTNRWFDSELPRIRDYLCKARGVSDIIFQVKVIDPLIFKDYKQDPTNFNHTGLNWTWIKAKIFETKADMEVLHVTRKQLKDFGISAMETLGGEYDVDKDNTLDFMVAIDQGVPSKYPNLSEFQRVFIHEACHGFAHWTQNNPSGLVHIYDEKQGRLPDLPQTFDFRPHTILSKMVEITKEMLSMALNNNKSLYDVALAACGSDASPLDKAPDELGCAESVSNLIKKVLPTFPILLSTAQLWQVFKTDKRFKEVLVPMKGDIIISPTGTSISKKVTNGHVGICGENGAVMSNTSLDGIFRSNYTQTTWANRWAKNGYIIKYYRMV